MKLTNNFHLEEFRCNILGKPEFPVDQVPLEYITNVKELARNLQILRNVVEKPITIISGYRTPEYNKDAGGEKNSFHLKAMAADIKIKGLKPAGVREIILQLIEDGHMKQGGVGIYNTFVHYDIRGTKARWDKRTK